MSKSARVRRMRRRRPRPDSLVAKWRSLRNRSVRSRCLIHFVAVWNLTLKMGRQALITLLHRRLWLECIKVRLSLNHGRHTHWGSDSGEPPAKRTSHVRLRGVPWNIVHARLAPVFHAVTLSWRTIHLALKLSGWEPCKAAEMRGRNRILLCLDHGQSVVLRNDLPEKGL